MRHVILESAKSVFKIMKSNITQKQASVYISTYAGGGSELLDPFIGDPCLVCSAESDVWLGKGVFKVGAIENPNAPVLFLENRTGDSSFHYVLMDPSDPALRRSLEIWMRKRCFVVLMRTAGGVAINGCRLADDGIQLIKRLLSQGQKPKSKSYKRFVQSALERQALEHYALTQLKNEGSSTATPVVEVQILSSGAIRRSDERDPAHPFVRGLSGSEAGSQRQQSAQTLRPMVPLGTIHKARDFVEISSSAAKMNPEAPVLTATVDIKRFMDASRAAGCFGFGNFRVDGRLVLSFRMQSGSAQVYWLADSADPEVWRTIDNMKKCREAGFMLTQGKESLFIPWKLEGQSDVINSFRAESLSHPGGMSDAAAYLASTGFVEAQATTDIPDIELSYVQVNLLFTPTAEMVEAAMRAMKAAPSAYGDDSVFADVSSGAHTLH
ncbi:hypothetical protein [Paraburkholderia azotifigens]|uniref:Uncharacterized protein n=1 Tax=Paraburkholderia azotifigens TaxID=2057004 RepID=A0A5C6VBL7_9BURK|nr:hypothetical protein [Paraburkholderia azotifigens]TXC80598.1 hypothetical protein FRZ40_40795 [Paraburkholderia azotifigens]